MKRLRSTQNAVAALKRIVILTKAELRHSFFKKAIALDPQVEVLRTYCEEMDPVMEKLLKEEETGIRKQHLLNRLQSEKDFFEALVRFAPDRSKSVFIANNAINEPRYFEEIQSLNPDLLIAYGCSLIKGPLLSEFPGRFLNVHLGLSPYYRGTGTNFWPLVNKEPEFVGATFLHIDAGVDTGKIIHQIRARIFPGDSPHQIGNRLIVDMTHCFLEIIKNFDALEEVETLPPHFSSKYYKRKDFSESSVKQLYENFEEGLVTQYLGEKNTREGRAPIVLNPIVQKQEESFHD